MSLEPIGLLTIAIGLFCLSLGYRAVVVAFVGLTVLGSAAAILIGSINIPPAHLFLLFLAFSALSWQANTGVAIRSISLPAPGFWLFCFLAYGLLSAVFWPRLFAGMTTIIPLGASEYDGKQVPIGPVSSNFTQSIYLISGVICFAVVSAIAATEKGFKAVVSGLLLYAAANIVFAILDLATSASGTGFLLDFIRNANYTMHHEESVGSMKRIVGSWPEASAFAGMSLGILAFTGTLWVCGQRPGLTGTLAAATLFFILISTSSTGLLAAPVVVLIIYLTAAHLTTYRASSRYSSYAVLFFPVVALLLTAFILANSSLYELLFNYVNELILSKPTSDSGVERASWNALALQNFFDTWGLGAGLGTNRSSSFPLALLSNVGVPGAAFYLLFILSAFGISRGQRFTFAHDTRLAARNACLALMVGGLLSSPTVDQGLLFYALAALACATPDVGEAASGSAMARG
jgi:hypothetical protein